MVLPVMSVRYNFLFEFILFQYVWFLLCLSMYGFYVYYYVCFFVCCYGQYGFSQGINFFSLACATMIHRYMVFVFCYI
jgi:hypothetical protein